MSACEAAQDMGCTRRQQAGRVGWSEGGFDPAGERGGYSWWQLPPNNRTRYRMVGGDLEINPAIDHFTWNFAEIIRA